MPQLVKGFSALNYTGTQSKVIEYQNNTKWYSIAEINANQLIPTATQQKKAGWAVNYIKTDLEGGEIKEFQNNDCDVVGDGIGNPSSTSSDAQNYFLTVKIDTTCSNPS